MGYWKCRICLNTGEDKELIYPKHPGLFTRDRRVVGYDEGSEYIQGDLCKCPYCNSEDIDDIDSTSEYGEKIAEIGIKLKWLNSQYLYSIR